MTYKGVISGEEYGVLKPFHHPLTFTCFVGGRQLEATIVGQLDNPVDYIFRIQFSDGYLSDFYSGELGWRDAANDFKDGIAPARKTPYVNAIKSELDCAFGVMTSKRSYVFRTKVDGEDANVFVHYQEYEDCEAEYSVHFKGDYRFTMHKRKAGWEVFSKRKGQERTLDPNIARNIGLLIESKED